MSHSADREPITTNRDNERLIESFAAMHVNYLKELGEPGRAVDCGLLLIALDLAGREH